MLCLAVFLPIIAGLAMLIYPPKTRGYREWAVECVTLFTSFIVLLCLAEPRETPTVAFMLMKDMPIAFQIDGLGSVFTALVAFLWPLAALYGFEYMEHEGGENHFFALYTITYGVTLGISTAANIMTMYIFYEFLTLCTLPLVMHGTKGESVKAGHQYMIYSFFGAAIGFVGVMIIVAFGQGGTFTMGGVLSEAFAQKHPLLLRFGYLSAFFGFGVKAAIFPLHAWLPKASVAPTPVTALLHAVAVVKSGVFAIMRVTYFSFGAHLLRGTWAQHIALLMTVITIVYGSTMAVREHHFKRRLAYSTISNLSYIAMAACLMTAEGLTASLAHMVFHALMKITLFYCAGAVLVRTHRTQIEGLRGLGSVMPFTCGVYTIAALALMGTPLLPGFASKWMIGSAAVSSGTLLGFAGVAAILVSAVLTAIYLMSVAFFMWFRPLEDTTGINTDFNYDPTWKMKLPLLIITIAIVACGVFSNNIIECLAAVSAGVI
ncbi:MAG: proton-conducting membrane transporter [Clostridia bacterium]|nr:proton-conducting membrane transporter [Clostridia bacterium]